MGLAAGNRVITKSRRSIHPYRRDSVPTWAWRRATLPRFAAPSALGTTPASARPRPGANLQNGAYNSRCGYRNQANATTASLRAGGTSVGSFSLALNTTGSNNTGPAAPIRCDPTRRGAPSPRRRQLELRELARSEAGLRSSGCAGGAAARGALPISEWRYRTEVSRPDTWVPPRRTSARIWPRRRRHDDCRSGCRWCRARRVQGLNAKLEQSLRERDAEVVTARGDRGAAARDRHAARAIRAPSCEIAELRATQLDVATLRAAMTELLRERNATVTRTSLEP